jgi:hypothetical protein
MMNCGKNLKREKSDLRRRRHKNAIVSDGISVCEVIYDAEDEQQMRDLISQHGMLTNFELMSN